MLLLRRLFDGAVIVVVVVIRVIGIGVRVGGRIMLFDVGVALGGWLI